MKVDAKVFRARCEREQDSRAVNLRGTIAIDSAVGNCDTTCILRLRLSSPEVAGRGRIACSADLHSLARHCACPFRARMYRRSIGIQCDKLDTMLGSNYTGVLPMVLCSRATEAQIGLTRHVRQQAARKP